MRRPTLRAPRRSQPLAVASEYENANASESGSVAAAFSQMREGFATRGRRAATFALLAVVIAAVAAMSFSGLFAFFTGPMHWSHGHSLLGPVSLDLAAIVVYGFALDRIEKGETGAQFRLMALVLVGLSAFINWRGALASGNVSEELFFPAMSILVYWMAHAILGAFRRDVRRAQHGYKAKAKVEPLPPFGVLVWLPWIGAPGEALKAVQAAVRKRLAVTPTTRTRRPVPGESASGPVRLADQRAAATANANASETANRTEGQPLAPVASEASGTASDASESADASAIRTGATVAGHGSQSAAIRLAIATLASEHPGEEVRAADVVALLAERDQQVPIGRVNDVIRRDRLRVVPAREEQAG